MNNNLLLIASILGTASISYLIYHIKIKFLKNHYNNVVVDMEKKYNEQKKTMFQEFVDYMAEVMGIFSTNMYFGFDSFMQNTDYNLMGAQIFLTEGVIVEKKHISKDEIIDNIVDKAKNNFLINTSDNTVKDYYIVRIISKHNSKEYMVNDKSLYENVDQSDIVFLTIVDNEIHNIGYPRRVVNES